MNVETRQNRASLYAFLGVMLIVTVSVLYMIAPYMISVVMGGILALLFMPVYRWMTARKLKPRLASMITTIGIIVLVLGPFLTFSAMAIKQAMMVAQRVSQSETSIQEVLGRIVQFPAVHFIVDDAVELETMLKSGLKSASTNLTGFIVGLASGVPQVMLQLVLASLACFFFLIDGRSGVTWVSTKLPIDLEIRTKLQGSFRDTAISVVWASMAASGSQALVMFLAFVILRVPAGFLAAGATFILAWIPLVGTAPVWLAGAAYLFFKGETTLVIVMAGFGFLTSLIDNFVRPWVLKGRGEMHPLVSLVAIFGGISMFGVVGVFFGPILAAVFITVMQVWPTVGRRSGLQFAGTVENPASSPPTIIVTSGGVPPSSM